MMSLFTQVRALEARRIRSICSGEFSSGAVDDAGRAYSWGHGIFWTLGHGEGKHEATPRRVSMACHRVPPELIFGHDRHCLRGPIRSCHHHLDA